MAEIVNILDLKPHPKRKHFAPDLPDAEYKNLKADIEVRGIQDALHICGNVILCGYNRYRAAMELGLKSLPVERKDGLTASQQIIHATKDNILRRQMEEDQIAAISSDPIIANAIRQEGKRRMQEGGSRGGKAAPGAGRGKKKAHKPSLNSDYPCKSKEIRTTDILAAQAGVSRHKIEQAMTLWEKDPEKAQKLAETGNCEGQSLARVVGEINRKEKATEVQKQIENGVEEFEKVFKLQRFDVWTIKKLDPGFGIEWPGNIPGSLVANILYYLTKPGDCILDPMAGGGVTIDVCKALGRNCLASDINPSRPEIIQRKIEDGPPYDAAGNMDLVFLDPPYWTLKDSDYSSEGASGLNWSDWLKWLQVLADYSFKCLKSGGYVAALMQDNLTKNVEKGNLSKPSILSFHDELRKSGFTFQIEISVPLTTQQISAREMEWAKLNKRLLGIRRSLLIYQK